MIFAAPDWRSGIVCLPISWVMRTLSVPSCVIWPLPGSSRLKSVRLLAVLLEDDANRLHRRGVGRGDRDLQRRRRTDEFFGFFDGDGGWRHAPGDDPGAAGGDEQDQDESDEIFHPLIIVGSLRPLGCGRGRSGGSNRRGACAKLGSSGRYRLGVRTRGSQPRDRGSNPRTGTNLRQTARYARWLRLAGQRRGSDRRRLSPEAARAASAWRRGTTSRFSSPRVSILANQFRSPADSGPIRAGGTFALS